MYSARVVAAWVARGRSLQIIACLGTGAVTASLVFGGTGCVAAPPGPRGPLRGEPGLEGAIDYSAAFSNAEAEIQYGPPWQEPSPRTVSGTSDHYWAPYTVFPPRAELRLAPLPWFDLGGHLGWLDGGFETRVGLPASPSRVWAVNVAAGMRTGELGPFKDTKEQRALFGRVEAYPLVHGERGRLVLALGLDSGTFYHQINYRDEYDQGDGLGFSAVQVIRDELRLESALGYVFVHAYGSVLGALEPYAVLDSGEPKGCSGCEPVPFRQSFGIVAVFRFSLAISFERGFSRRVSSPSVRPERR